MELTITIDENKNYTAEELADIVRTRKITAEVIRDIYAAQEEKQKAKTAGIDKEINKRLKKYGKAAKE